jgi:hypothetical protein
MKKKTNSQTIAVVGASVPNQIAGQWFPHGPIKKGTRWFYITLLIIIAAQIISYIIFTWYVSHKEKDPQHACAQVEAIYEETLDGIHFIYDEKTNACVNSKLVTP